MARMKATKFNSHPRMPRPGTGSRNATHAMPRQIHAALPAVLGCGATNVSLIEGSDAGSPPAGARLSQIAICCAAPGPDGEIGRRNGLKIRRPQGHVGSIPTPGTSGNARSVERRQVAGRDPFLAIGQVAGPRGLPVLHAHTHRGRLSSRVHQVARKEGFLLPGHDDVRESWRRNSVSQRSSVELDDHLPCARIDSSCSCYVAQGWSMAATAEARGDSIH